MGARIKSRSQVRERRYMSSSSQSFGPHMTSRASVSGDDILRDAQNFSLVLGGPLFQLLRRAHLSDGALMMLRQRIIFLSLFAWLPLLALSALEGHLFSNSVAVPFVL